MEIKLRKQAKAEGSLRYYTGNPCKRGHISERWVFSGTCISCAVLGTQRWRKYGATSSNKSPYKPMPSVEYLNEVFDYRDGLLYWKVRPESHFNNIRGWRSFNSVSSGKVAGHVHKSNGYVEVRLGKKLYKGHRIIYKMMTGYDGELQIDHIDRNPSNNLFDNLRLATNQENSLNRHNSRDKGDKID